MSSIVVIRDTGLDDPNLKRVARTMVDMYHGMALHEGVLMSQGENKAHILACYIAREIIDTQRTLSEYFTQSIEISNPSPYIVSEVENVDAYGEPHGLSESLDALQYDIDEEDMEYKGPLRTPSIMARRGKVTIIAIDNESKYIGHAYLIPTDTKNTLELVGSRPSVLERAKESNISEAIIKDGVSKWAKSRGLTIMGLDEADGDVKVIDLIPVNADVIKSEEFLHDLDLLSRNIEVAPLSLIGYLRYIVLYHPKIFMRDDLLDKLKENIVEGISF